jgi:tetratricopeptide (TPR) repeat protein
MRDALPELGVRARIGVNTGEVVTGTAERLATGDAVNVAARLEQAAEPGEVLIGEETLRLVRDAVEAEPAEPLALKGKSAPVRAYRLASAPRRAERRAAAPMVGRERELRALRDAFARAVHDRSCQLFTVLGTAGVGKSRLASEVLADVNALVVRGHCLSYGVGITYWPVVEVLKQLDTLPADEGTATPLRALLGETGVGTTPDEIAWAFRKLLEQETQARPVVCVLDDLHWAEPTLLDLVEHLADLSRDAPILLLCIARPELLERRPGWGGGKWNATTVLLEPLDAEETARLLDELGGANGELRDRILAAAEGNPLFLEEMLALVRQSHGSDVAVPPTIQALLAARLDQLDPDERSVLERGSVEGRVFHRGAVEALSDGDGQVASRLVALVRKELVRPDRAQLQRDEAYRFRHLLIRDAAYDALPKAIRADLHERFAEWLERRGADLVELEEILGHHLEQAARYRRDLGRPDAGLAEHAGDHLASAGRRARWRGDSRAAAGLLERALELLRPLRLDVTLELDLAAALEHDYRRAAAVAGAAAERARVAGNAAGEAVARMMAALWSVDTGTSVDEIETLAREAQPLVERAGDDAALVRVWSVLGWAANFRGQSEQQAVAAERALSHALRAGQRPAFLFGLAPALVVGPRPADEALRTLDAVLPPAPHPSPLLMRAWLLAMLGRFDEAWPLARSSSERLLEFGGYDGGEILGEIAILEGDHEAAVRHFESACAFFESRALRGLLSTCAPMAGRSLCALGRHDEAEPLAQRGRELGGEDDVATQAIWRRVEALVLSRRGGHSEAETLARQAVAITAQTDWTNRQGEALCDLAEVLLAAGRTDEATATLADALERYESKRNLPMATEVRGRLTALREEPLPAS